MLKVIPVEKAVGTLLAHDVTEIVPGKHKRPAFRRGHRIKPGDVPKLLDIGKANLYVMELEEGELHEEDACRPPYPTDGSSGGSSQSGGRNLRITKDRRGAPLSL
jgi:hypothetical protein